MESAPSPSIGYARQLPIKPAPWHALVAWDMFFNAWSPGLFLTAALCEFTAPTIFAPILCIAYPLAWLFLAADLVLLVLDLGDPKRFHHMLRVFKPSSPMSLGVWSLSAYSLPLTVAAICSFLPNLGAVPRVRLGAAIVGLAPAFASVAYKGVLFSTSAQPGWKDARWLGGWHTFGAIVLGCATLLLLAVVMNQPIVIQRLRWALVILLFIQFIPTVLLTAELWPTAKQVFTRTPTSIAILAIQVVALIVPLIIALIDGDRLALLIAGLLVGARAFCARFLIVYLPHLPTRKMSRGVPATYP